MFFLLYYIFFALKAQIVFQRKIYLNTIISEY